MNRRYALKILAWGIALSAIAARADDDGSDQSRGAQSGQDGGAGEKPDAAGDAGSGSSDEAGRGAMNQDDAKRAVDTSEALPLSVVLDKFRHSGNFTLVNVTLVSRHGRLYYVLEYVGGSGAVQTAVYDARDGSQVR